MHTRVPQEVGFWKSCEQIHFSRLVDFHDLLPLQPVPPLTPLYRLARRPNFLSKDICSDTPGDTPGTDRIILALLSAVPSDGLFCRSMCRSAEPVKAWGQGTGGVGPPLQRTTGRMVLGPDLCRTDPAAPSRSPRAPSSDRTLPASLFRPWQPRGRRPSPERSSATLRR